MLGQLRSVREHEADGAEVSPPGVFVEGDGGVSAIYDVQDGSQPLSSALVGCVIEQPSAETSTALLWCDQEAGDHATLRGLQVEPRCGQGKHSRR